jgi:mono/diheme cytochrome c family protein
MITSLLAAVLLGGTGCQVVVRQQAVTYAAPVYRAANVSYATNHAYVAASTYAPTYATASYSPYYTQAALAYKVEDPEKAAYIRLNEKLTDAVILTAASERSRANRLEQALGQMQVAGGSDGVSEPLRQATPGAGGGGAIAVLQKHCLSCHGTGKSAASNFELAPYPNLPQRVLINLAVNGDGQKVAHMPPKDKGQLSDAEKKAVEAFAEAGPEELRRLGSKASANDPPAQAPPGK